MLVVFGVIGMLCYWYSVVFGVMAFDVNGIQCFSPKLNTVNTKYH